MGCCAPNKQFLEENKNEFLNNSKKSIEIINNTPNINTNNIDIFLIMK